MKEILQNCNSYFKCYSKYYLFRGRNKFFLFGRSFLLLTYSNCTSPNATKGFAGAVRSPVLYIFHQLFPFHWNQNKDFSTYPVIKSMTLEKLIKGRTRVWRSWGFAGRSWPPNGSRAEPWWEAGGEAPRSQRFYSANDIKISLNCSTFQVSNWPILGPFYVIEML